MPIFDPTSMAGYAGMAVDPMLSRMSQYNSIGDQIAAIDEQIKQLKTERQNFSNKFTTFKSRNKQPMQKDPKTGIMTPAVDQFGQVAEPVDLFAQQDQQYAQQIAALEKQKADLEDQQRATFFGSGTPARMR